MRILLVAVVALAACHDEEPPPTCVWDGRVYQEGDAWPAGDGCNDCFCLDGEVACTDVGCLPDVDAGPASCWPTMGCAVGPACGGVCCDTGEACVNGECRCGDGPACAPGDSCEAFGPVGGDACGAVCCGASGPCPQ